MNLKQETILKPIVASFVASLNGRFKDHASDPLLVALLMYRLADPVSNHRPDVSRAECILSTANEVKNEAYEAACPIFENMLEYGCRVNCNGHHVAQAFAKHVKESLPHE